MKDSHLRTLQIVNLCIFYCRLNKMKNENKDLKASNEKLEQQMLQKSEELATLKNRYIRTYAPNKQ